MFSRYLFAATFFFTGLVFKATSFGAG